MIVTYTFDTLKEEDIEDRKIFEQAKNMYCALFSIKNYLSSIRKYPARLDAIEEKNNEFVLKSEYVSDISDEVGDEVRSIILDYCPEI